jgi:GNAT superfamily N-acetyltransferase
MTFGAPRPLRPGDRLDGFDCGQPQLNQWLLRRALRAERERTARTYVSGAAAQDRVAGYYCLSAFSVERAGAPGALARNAPDPVPAALLGRLAVDLEFQGARLGTSLLHHAVMTAEAAAERVGLRALVVDALSEDAAAFYASHGFKPFTNQPLRLFHRL